MKFTVKIEQTLTGYEDIEADSPEEALQIAERRFNSEGEELPQMESLYAVDISIYSQSDGA